MNCKSPVCLIFQAQFLIFTFFLLTGMVLQTILKNAWGTLNGKGASKIFMAEAQKYPDFQS